MHILKNSFSNLPNVNTTILGIVPYINAEILSQFIKNSTTFFDFNLRSIVLYLPKKLVKLNTVDEQFLKYLLTFLVTMHKAMKNTIKAIMKGIMKAKTGFLYSTS